MTFYADIEGAAQDMLREFGRQCFIVKPGAETGAEYNPTIGAGTPQAFTAVLTDYRQGERDGTLVQINDRRAIVSTEGLAVVPTPQDRFRIDGKDFEIVSVSPVQPAETVVIYKLQVRF